MGWAGAGVSIFLTAAGTYQIGTQTITNVEDGIDSLYWYFGDDNMKVLREVLQDETQANNMNNFLQVYFIDFVLTLAVIFWHVMYLLSLAFAMSWQIFQKIKDLDSAASGGDVDINSGWKLLLFGTFYGTMSYVAAITLQGSQDIIMRMVGLNGREGPQRSTTKQFNYPTATGTTTQTIQTNFRAQFFKNFVSLEEISQNWSIFYLAQRFVQIITPYMYIAFIEIGVLFVFVIIMQFI